ncbi:MAG: diaminopimelate epimerase [Candidatus Obscuribacterales bacterium]|nr:diaminopimelate epimerase [Steroidobacteraceae bacterium]
MLLKFTKMHGLGNDFIVFEAPTDEFIPTTKQLQALANRRTGIGFDQALVLQPPRQPNTDVFYRNFNADGSEVEQCGNGARCIASLVAKKLGLRRALRMDTVGGKVDAQVHSDGTVSLDMGEPNFNPAALPFDAAHMLPLYPLQVGAQQIEIGAVSMGNPHAVWRVPSVMSAPVDTVGAAVENHPRFANRVNVGFMEVVARDHIRLRVFERGVGETQACGTGACAAVAVGRQLDWLDGTVNVDFPGGRAIVSWQGPGTHLWLTGPAVTVFEGQIELSELQRE